jgi:hypothetical protein
MDGWVDLGSLPSGAVDDSFDSCLEILELCQSRIVSPEITPDAAKLALNVINSLLLVEKYKLEILSSSSAIFCVLYSLAEEYFEDIEFVSSLLIFSNHIFEIFLDQEPDPLDVDEHMQVSLPSPLSHALSPLCFVSRV